MIDKIGPFKRYTKKPNDITYGSIFYANFILPVPYFPKRTIRVFLPEDFDFNQKYPVIFMSDGQNIVDKYTTAFGAWEIDKRQHELIKEGYPSFIVVGIDCPKKWFERALEYSFPHMKIEQAEFLTIDFKYEPYSQLLHDYIANELYPLIKQYFPIADERKLTAVGGSSMGGVFALSSITRHPELFGYALCFSPAFHIYNRDEVNKYMEEAMQRMDKTTKFTFYSGGVDFEASFVEPATYMHRYLLEHGYKNVQLILDPKEIHNESAWSKHFNEAIKFWLDKKQ